MTTIKVRRNTSVQWTALNPILDAGEQGLELDTQIVKYGDGLSRWNELEAHIPESYILAAISQAFANANPGSPEGQQALSVHINSDSPHPVYDDGPSLLLLYQNAKV